MEKHQKKKFGLLTPYTGWNLGDGAIQEALIWNLRKSFPDCELCGFTLYPENTEKVHGIKCFSLTGFAVQNYSPIGWEPIVLNESTIGFAERRQKLKIILKKISLVSNLAKRTFGLRHAIRKALGNVRRECAHLLASIRIVRRLDAVIVAGGGQLDDYWGGPWGHPYTLLRWAVLSKLFQKKLLFVSVGTAPIDSTLSRVFVKLALYFANYRSYRDETSKDLLKTISFTRNDTVFPDLAFGYPVSEKDRGGLSHKPTMVVGVSPIAYLSKHAWPRENISIYERYLGELVSFIEKLSSKQYQVILFSTDMPDRKAIRDIVEILKRRRQDNLSRRLRILRIVTVSDLTRQLMPMDFVVASRLHGVLLSNVMIKPALAISYERKVNTHMDEMGQSDFCLDIHDFDADMLWSTFVNLVAKSDDVKGCLHDKIKEYLRQLEQQYVKLEYLLR